ncbi:MAG: hypothetical protein DRI95_13325 [Bacteroidetes bacterium]|nr:MAG: hypothetical protein DRI95_13325 [Bacteroidota bacterium]
MTRKRKKTNKKIRKQPKEVISENTEVPETKKRSMVPYLVLFILPFLLYGYSITFEYVLDDKIVLSENRFVQQGFSGVKDIFTTESFTGYFGEQKDILVGARYRPLSIATFAVEYGIWGFNTKASHFINILLYALTGVLLFIVLSNLFRSKDSKWYFSIPFVASLLFILHPLHTEVIANIKSRDEILSLLFSIWALFSSYRYVVTKKNYLLLLSLFLFSVALFAKESAITFVAVIPLTLYFFTKNSVKTILKASLPLLTATIIFLVVRYQAIGYFLDTGKEVTALMNNPYLGVWTADKYATIFYTMGVYLKLLIFPHPLTHDYYPYHIPIMTWADIGVIISLIAYVAMLGYAIITIKRKSIIAWAILYYLLTFSIVSNLVIPIGTTMNERFMYMPSLGFTVLLSYFILRGIPKLFSNSQKLSKITMLGLLLLFSIGFAYKTVDRVPAWENEMALNRAAIKVSVNSARANQFMGYSIYRALLDVSDREEKRKMLDEASVYIDKALRIHPIYKDANNTKAGLLAGYYQLDRDLQKLLDGFYLIQTKKEVPFVDTYLNYLDGRADQNLLSDFYKRIGTVLVKNGYTDKGNYYLSKISP